MSIKSVSAANSTRAGTSQKCCILLAAGQHFVQMLAKALPSMKSVIRQIRRRWNWQIRTFRASMTSRCHDFPFTACTPPDCRPRPVHVLCGTSWHAQACPKVLLQYLTQTWPSLKPFVLGWSWFYRLVGLVVVRTHGLCNSMSEFARHLNMKDLNLMIIWE